MKRKLLIVAAALAFGSVPVLAQTSTLRPSFEEAAALYSDENFKAAYEIAVPLATAGNVSAQLMLGEMYELGRGVKTDLATAMRWYESAATQNHAGAMFRVGMLYLGDKTGKPDPVKAREWLAKAAKAGNMQASNELGLIYYQGLGVEADAETAAKYISAAADSGLAQAQYNLGLLYVNGHGVNKDMLTAGQWFQKAAVQGLPEAALDYGLMVYGGDAGIRRDYKIGAQWLMVAAREGNAEAQLFIARILAAGRGMEKNRVEAAKFYLLAKQAGKSDADLDVMISNLSSPQLADAERQARIFQESLKRKRLNATGGKTDKDG
jgi:TPR repeat protein